MWGVVRGGGGASAAAAYVAWPDDTAYCRCALGAYLVLAVQYTPHSMAGMNNATAEIAGADAYASTMRFFTVGQETQCGDPKKGQVDCSKPFPELDTPNKPSGPGGPCRKGSSCRELWAPASAAALGNTAWNTFSAVCYLTGRQIHDALGGEVPIGLISSNWGGTPIQVRPRPRALFCLL